MESNFFLKFFLREKTVWCKLLDLILLVAINSVILQCGKITQGELAVIQQSKPPGRLSRLPDKLSKQRDKMSIFQTA